MVGWRRRAPSRDVMSIRGIFTRKSKEYKPLRSESNSDTDSDDEESPTVQNGEREGLQPPSKPSAESCGMDLDSILHDLGQFGKYQLINNILLGLCILFSVASSMSYVFTASDLDYRCRIPDCDGAEGHPSYMPQWLRFAVPFKNLEKPSKCHRYETLPDFEDELNVIGACPSARFLTNVTERCENWVFKDTENTILREFDLMCDENRWKLTLVGTLNNIGQFVGLPFAGMISDAYGRRFLMVTGTLLSAMFGCLRAFSTNYLMFLVLEFLDSVASTGVFSATFILGLELVGPSKRVLGSTILSCFYPIGEVLMGLVMWWLQDWRSFLLSVYLPGLFFVSYFWIVPESIRWLAMKNRYSEVITVIRTMEIVNRKKLSKNLENELDQLPTEKAMEITEIKIINEKMTELEPDSKSEAASTASTGSAFGKIFKSRVIMLRLLNCSFCWMTNTFVFYGLSLNATDIAGNKYLNYIAVSSVELPAFFVTYLLMDRVGRRPAQSLSLCLCGVVCCAFAVVPAEMMMFRMILFLTGKFMITMSFTIVYVFTIEMFPTELRHSLLGSCSMLGRVGSMIAPQTPLLATYFGDYVPVLLFGAVSLTAGALALLFPETLNKKLPDTVEEASKMNNK